MTDRERFEAFMEHKACEWAWDGDGIKGYEDERTNHAWRVWQASRKQALEEAKDACFIQYPSGLSRSMEDVKFNLGVSASIQAIDALANPEGEQG